MVEKVHVYVLDGDGKDGFKQRAVSTLMSDYLEDALKEIDASVEFHPDPEKNEDEFDITEINPKERNILVVGQSPNTKPDEVSANMSVLQLATQFPSVLFYAWTEEDVNAAINTDTNLGDKEVKEEKFREVTVLMPESVSEDGTTGYQIMAKRILSEIKIALKGS